MKKEFLTIIIVILMVFLLLSGCATDQNDNGSLNSERSENDGSPIVLPDDYVAAHPDPEYDNFTWTLPTGASPLRLSLPADIDDFLLGGPDGYIGGYGMAGGEHIEGLDHVWINLKKGTPVKSWADGEVIEVLYHEDIKPEYSVEIDYGYNLIGVHGEIETLYVELGDHVKRGEEIGIGVNYHELSSSAEFSLTDLGRWDGVNALKRDEQGRYGSSVSPFDYLEDEDKRILVDAYIEKVITPFVEDGTISGEFQPAQPYLTNEPLFPPEHEKFYGNSYDGKLSGSWLLISSNWEYGYPNDLLTFIEADNPYYKGNVVKGIDDHMTWGTDIIYGTFEVDYEKNHVAITQGEEHVDNTGHVYYGLFEFDESGDRTRLKIEYNDETYPTNFSDEAITYIRRSSYDRRYDAVFNLGVYEFE